jgi:hypothetical protein
MPACLEPGNLILEGSDVPIVRPATVLGDGGTCYDYLVLYQSDYDAIRAIESRVTQLEATGGGAGGASIFSMSVEDGALISGAITTLWCIAWAIKAVRRAL